MRLPRTPVSGISRRSSIPRTSEALPGCGRGVATLAPVALVDVVVVTFNSAREIRSCVEPLSRDESVRVIVVDNASSDDTLGSVADLPVETVLLNVNKGFAHGCNEGWRRGNSPLVLFLNPDARITSDGLHHLVRELQGADGAGAAAPKILHADGTLDYSQRRFPSLVSTYAQALFVHRLAPRASWTDEVVRTVEAYERRGSPDWVSGACVLVRRSALERVGGLDAGFFMYCEDTDLCRRLRDHGFDVVYEPETVVVHEGGASAPRASLLPVLAASRLRYAGKHSSRPAALLARLGIALGAVTHSVVSRGGPAVRAGHLRAFRQAVAGVPTQSDHPSG